MVSLICVDHWNKLNVTVLRPMFSLLYDYIQQGVRSECEYLQKRMLLREAQEYCTLDNGLVCEFLDH